MTLIVEDGTGLSTAESYISVADADSYHSDMGNAAWTGTDAAKEAALRKAAQYLDIFYGDRWKGYKSTDDQALTWPRAYAYDEDGYLIAHDSIPDRLVRACAELALIALSETLLPDVQNPGSIKRRSVKVGEIEKDVEYQGSASQLKQYSVAHYLVRVFLTAGGMVNLVRV